MNWEQIEGKWDQMKGQVKEKWGKLTKDDLTVIEGKKDQLVGKLRERYGYTLQQANTELGSFITGCKCEGDLKSSAKKNKQMMNTR